PSPYSAGMLHTLAGAARPSGVELAEGIYAAVTGPCYETPAEIRALRAWGADAVGMSTARGIRAGAGAGVRSAAISCIPDDAPGLAGHPLNHEEVLAMGRQQSARIARLLTAVLARIT